MGFAEKLREVVGNAHVIDDPQVCATFGRDWTGRWGHTPALVVRPANVDQVAAVIRLCASHDSIVTTQGGNTGLVGGSIPGDDPRLAVVLSTTRLTQPGPIEYRGQQPSLVVGAGTTIADLHRAAAKAGLVYGVDLASRDSATIGGTVATNAGGIRVCQYGDTRAQVLGLRAVLANGSVLDHLSPPAKDSSGFDVWSLLIGSEGALAVITDVRVKLWPPQPRLLTTMAGLPSIEAAQATVAAIPAADLYAAELIDARGMAAFAARSERTPPLALDHPWYLLLEVGAANADELDLPAEAVVGAGLWGWREGQTETIAAIAQARSATVHKFDVAVPSIQLATFVSELEILAPQAFVFGHLAEANLHVNVVIHGEADQGIDELVLALVARHRGTISAEHGVGRAKAASLHLTKSAAEIATMQAIKTALDPANLLNPGALLATQ